MKTCLVYITVPEMQEAERIGAFLLEQRLAAGVNLIPGMKAMYWWKDKKEESGEVVLVVKTRQSLAGRLVEKVKSMHSYECPCIAVLPILDGNPDFLDWIRRETRSCME